jgi:hypothetical protein
MSEHECTPHSFIITILRYYPKIDVRRVCTCVRVYVSSDDNMRARRS